MKKLIPGLLLTLACSPFALIAFYNSAPGGVTNSPTTWETKNYWTNVWTNVITTYDPGYQVLLGTNIPTVDINRATYFYFTPQQWNTITNIYTNVTFLNSVHIYGTNQWAKDHSILAPTAGAK